MRALVCDAKGCGYQHEQKGNVRAQDWLILTAHHSFGAWRDDVIGASRDVKYLGSIHLCPGCKENFLEAHVLSEVPDKREERRG